MEERVGGARVYWFDADGPAAKAGEVILLTSGTSGFASGCVHDFSSLMLNARRHAESIGQTPGDTVLVSLPLYFSFALVAQAMGSMVAGNRLVIGGPPFHVPSFVKSIERFGVTVSSLTPVLVGSLLRSGVEIPKGLRVMTVGGDALASATVEELIRLRPGGELYLTYGLTQAGPRVSTLAAHREPVGRYGSVGLPLEGTGVRLEEVEGSGMKQLFVSSETVMKRRVGTHEGGVNGGNRIHRCEQPPPQPSPGVPGAGEERVWGEGEESGRREVATGDVFTRDDEGYLYFRGRMSDYIVRHGEKVCLAAVRRVAMGFANVVRATTPVSRHEYGEDFDLVLDVAGAEEDYHVLLRGWLKKSEMPREVRVVKRAMSEVGYK
jgi:acyl-CoA synthetase (AMP-forming)/AMP-acid ligase II